jgi:hypothetical protein
MAARSAEERFAAIAEVELWAPGVTGGTGFGRSEGEVVGLARRRRA